MITTVTLNAAIDKTYHVDKFIEGVVHRVHNVTSMPGGKGLNVSRVIQQVGGSTTATGFIAGKNGEFIAEALDDIQIANKFVKVNGESRLCLNILSDTTRQSTELLEPGPTVTQQHIAELSQRISELAKRSSIVAMSGSLPAGAPTSTYADLISIVKDHGALPFLDTSGEALIRGIQARPFFIKPNEDEISVLLGEPMKDELQVIKGIQQVMAQGISCVVVTLGASGSLAGYEGTCYRIEAPSVEAVNPVGCGDAFVAAMAVAFEQKHSIEDGLAYATAVATANAMTPIAGQVELEDIERLLPLVKVHVIN